MYSIRIGSNALMTKRLYACVMDISGVMNDLGQVRLFDYFKKRSMPEFVEPLIEELIASVSSMSALQRDQLRTVVNDRAAGILGWYARKVAGRAVRNSSPEDIWKAVLALAIAACKSDWRDTLAPVALVYDQSRSSRIVRCCRLSVSIRAE